ncbi:uncharacterized protein [Clytia hemisphaerica]|uniref:G-protein coupled receptors family 3 profile domain-containing protein n=1 Tax=Clytia hemisphaerica TaxID=252671 RepID=A0A7M5XHU9_9CNID
MASKSILILSISILVMVNVHQCKANLNSGTENEIVLGMFAKCEKDTVKGPNIIATELSNLMSRFQFLISRPPFSFVYHNADVCSYQDLLNTLIDLFTTNEFSTSQDTKVKHIVVYLPEEMLKLLLSLVSHTDIIIWPLQLIQDLVWFQGHPNYEKLHRKGVRKPAEMISDMMSTYEWRNAHVVDLFEMNKNPEVDVHKLITKLPRSTCLSYTSFEIGGSSVPDNLLKVLEQLKAEKEASVIFVVGTVGGKFKKLAVENGVSGKYWVIFSEYTDLESKDEYISIKNSGDIMYSGSLVFHNDRCAPGKKMTDCLEENTEMRDTVYRLKRNRIVQVRYISINTWKETRNYHQMEYLQLYNGSHNKFLLSLDQVKYTETFLETRVKSKCRKCLYCQDLCPDDTAVLNIEPGYYDKKFGLTCQKCPLTNRITEYGQCSLCGDGLKLNKNQTVCYDPVHQFEIHPSCYVISILGIGISLFILIIYWIYRETPVVKSSNFELSIIQLIFCILLHSSFFVFVVHKPTQMICTVRPVVFSTLLVAVVSIVVCKAEKILIIFYTRRRMTPKDIKDITMRQLVIFSFLISINFILVPAVFTLPASVESSPLENQEGYVQEFCSSDYEFYLQTIYAIVILLLSIVQGYRGRKLPANYNEGNSICLASATTLSALAFCIWILRSNQKSLDVYNRITMTWVSLSTALIFIVLCLHGVKVFVILFQGHKNTKTYQLHAMLADTMRDIEKVTLNPRKHSFTTKVEMIEIEDRSRSGSVHRLRTFSIQQAY